MFEVIKGEKKLMFSQVQYFALQIFTYKLKMM
jgi:hypothetical protein